MTDESDKDFTSDRIKHLEMIQGAITRMANSSAWMKRLAIVVVGGAAALAARGGSNASALPVLAVILTVIFGSWTPDTISRRDGSVPNLIPSEKKMPAIGPDFSMTPSKEIRSQSGFRPSALSWSSFPYYGALTAFLLPRMEVRHMTTPPLGPYGRGLLGRPSSTLLTSGIQPLRRVFFSFHYQRDIWRVNQVRNHWVAKDNRQAAGYFDGSLWEKAQAEGKARVKRLVNDGLSGSSVTCVLIGKETFQRHWVQYEIFQSIELGKGVFGVFIHGLKDRNGYTDVRGANPFEFLGYGTANNHPGKLVPYAQYKSGWKIYEDASPITPSAASYLQPNFKPMLSSLFPRLRLGCRSRLRQLLGLGCRQQHNMLSDE